jgi:hypothetical protein
MTERPPRWRWGAPNPEKPKLQPLLDALKRLWDGGLTATRVIAAFHQRRVLPLMARRLRLDQIEEGALLEGCRMFDTSLTAVEVTRRVTYMVAAGFTVVDLNRVKIRPHLGIHFSGECDFPSRTLSLSVHWFLPLSLMLSHR